MAANEDDAEADVQFRHSPSDEAQLSEGSANSDEVIDTVQHDTADVLGMSAEKSARGRTSDDDDIRRDGEEILQFVTPLRTIPNVATEDTILLPTYGTYLTLLCPRLLRTEDSATSQIPATLSSGQSLPATATWRPANSDPAFTDLLRYIEDAIHEGLTEFPHIFELSDGGDRKQRFSLKMLHRLIRFNPNITGMKVRLEVMKEYRSFMNVTGWDKEFKEPISDILEHADSLGILKHSWKWFPGVPYRYPFRNYAEAVG
eukprot:Clim_evm132s147 gene=Clim_evmTU132s147